MRRRVLLPIVLWAALAAPGRPAFGEPAGLAWSDWTPETFARAKREGRILLVEVSAAWCHWCHVMERETYADPRVRRAIEAAFLPVRVDADARPDLAERYAAYHWPATVFLSPDARPVTALRGYRGPDDFLAVLDRVRVAVRDGTPMPDAPPPDASAPAGAAGPGDLRALETRLRAVVDATWDPRQGGWGLGQKYPFAAPIEAALLDARRGDAEKRGRALRTLGAMESLIDPVDGGMYQYSEGGVWDRPHFERIASVQAGALSAYADALRFTGDAAWRGAALRLEAYLRTTLRSPDGVFFTSQDADVGAHGEAPFLDGHDWFSRDAAGRARLGRPRVDRAVYAQENGWIAKALVDSAVARGDPDLSAPRAALTRVLSTHADPRGGLRHAAGDAGPLHAGDTVAVGTACLALAQATGEASWRAQGVRLADDLLRLFGDGADGGVFATTPDGTAVGVFRERQKPFETNAAAARFLIAAAEATGTAAYRRAALGSIAAASAPGVPERFGSRAAALLVAVEEATAPWTHATLVSEADDVAGDALWKALAALDAPCLTRERAAPGEASAAAGTTYPPSPTPAVYLCGGGRCASPVTSPADLAKALRSLR